MTRKFWMLPTATQAALRCKEPAFQRYLTERFGWTGAIGGEGAAAAKVRALCGVASRARLATDPAAAARWFDLNRAYELWRDYPDLELLDLPGVEGA